MELIRGLINLQQQTTACVATIGNFDGVHLGHQAIVERVIARAKRLGLPSCVLLFEPHPREFFAGSKAPARLTCFSEKLHQLKLLGVDKLLVLQFNQSLREMEAVKFVADILIGKLKVKHLVVGDDFHFGHKRKGNFQLLEKMSLGEYTLEPTPSILVDDERVSSTLIRKALSVDNLEKTSKLLGRKYTMTGKVGYGQQLGRTIDFPTANVSTKRRKIPLKGVFLVKCQWQKGGKGGARQVAWGAANCGSRPTVGGQNDTLEVYLLGVSPDLYGIELMVEFFAPIRAEKKFAGIEELKHQIARDIEIAEKLISRFEQ